jgi:hypothetical protein
MTLDDGLIDLRVRALAVGADGRVRVGTVTGLKRHPRRADHECDSRSGPGA